jgi:hypothetical protein
LTKAQLLLAIRWMLSTPAGVIGVDCCLKVEVVMIGWAEKNFQSSSWEASLGMFPTQRACWEWMGGLGSAVLLW